MAETLDREDWENILHALAHFRHNPRFNETYGKVQAILSPGG